MSASVTILVEGYTNALESAGGEDRVARPTITLVRDGDLVMVVDPGNVENQQVIVDALAKEQLTLADVNVVGITHSHLDHYRNIGLFPRAKILEYSALWTGEKFESWPDQFSPHIQIVHTPGHDYTSITFMVSTEGGVMAICGDVFWKESYPREAIEDRYALDVEQLAKSRKMILKMADWIVPGHGPMYKVQHGLINGLKHAINGKLKKAVVCKKCGRPMSPKENCICRPWLCYRCCECGLDCEFCSCSHKKQWRS